MANRVLLKAARRSETGRKAVKQTRRTGFVPAVLYGGGKSQPLAVDKKDLSNVFHSSTSENILVDLEIKEDAKKRLALIQDVQHHCLKDFILHVDFQEIDEQKKFHVEVPVIALGEPIGVRTEGGILDHVLRTLKLECLPKDLPDHIEVDISQLQLKQTIHVRDIVLPQGVTALNAKDLSVFIVHEPKVVEEVAPAAAGEAQPEPEVIKEKKTEEGKEEEKGKDQEKGKEKPKAEKAKKA
ncbi:MAG: 50S ribosomal protein L25 [bacterium]